MIGFILPFLKSKLAAFGAVIVIILILIIGGPMVFHHAPRWWWYVAAGLVLLIFLIYLAIKAWRERKSARMLEGFLKKQADDQVCQAQPDVQDELAAIREKLDKSIAVLKRSRIARGRRGSEALYVLPWYMIIGPSAAGKSTLLRNSGLNFPAVDADDAGGGRVKGLGGTRNCDWWLSSQGIILDTAGRYAGTSGGADDREEWGRFLQMLKKARRRAPINGLILAVAIDEVLQEDDEGLDTLAKTLRSRIDELIVQLEILFPVYVVFTKCDLISGFTEYCRDFGRREREQVWGYTRRYEQSNRSPGEEFAQQTAQLAAVLEHRLGRQLTAAVSQSQKRGTYLFPIEFGATTRRLTRFVDALLQPNPYQRNPMVRGFYFTSGTQEGTPIGQVMAAMQRDFGLSSEEPLPEAQSETKPYFIKDLVGEVILPDEARVVPLSSAGRRRRWFRAAVNFGQTVAAALLVFGLFTSFVANNRANSNLAALTEDIARRVGASPGFSLEQLQTFDRLRGELDAAEAGPGFWRYMGLYSGEEVQRAARQGYFKVYNGLVLQPLDTALKNRLRAPADFSDAGTSDEYSMFATAYRMITMPYDSMSHSPQDLAGAADSVWRPAVSLDDTPRLARLVDLQSRYYMRHRDDTLLRWTRVSPDRELLREIDRRMANYWTPARLYQQIIRNANAELGYLSTAAIIAGTYRLTGGTIGKAFTREGWNEHVSKRIEGIPDEIAASPVWKEAFKAYDADEIRKLLTGRYVDEFRAAWRALVDSAVVVSFSNLTEAADALDELSQDGSPMITFLERVWEESKLEDLKGPDGKDRDAITDEVAPIARFLGKVDKNENADPPHISYLALLQEMPKLMLAERDELSSNARCALRLHNLKTVFEGAARKIKSMVVGSGLARSATRFLARPLHAAEAAARTDVCDCLNRVWNKDVAGDFNENFAGFYPFNTSSQTPASRSSITKFFGTQGIFTFEDAEAAPARREGITFSGEYGESLRRARRIKRVIPSGRARVAFSLRGRPEWMSGLKKQSLRFGGRTFEFTPGRTMKREYVWPYAAGDQNDVHLEVTFYQSTLFAQPITHSGDWAIFRFFDDARIVGDTCIWTITANSGQTFEVRYEVTGDGADFLRHGHFSHFRCPATVCR